MGKINVNNKSVNVEEMNGITADECNPPRGFLAFMP